MITAVHNYRPASQRLLAGRAFHLAASNKPMLEAIHSSLAAKVPTLLSVAVHRLLKTSASASYRYRAPTIRSWAGTRYARSRLTTTDCWSGSRIAGRCGFGWLQLEYTLWPDLVMQAHAATLVPQPDAKGALPAAPTQRSWTVRVYVDGNFVEPMDRSVMGTLPQIVKAMGGTMGNITAPRGRSVFEWNLPANHVAVEARAKQFGVDPVVKAFDGAAISWGYV